jgi:putative ABC transport system permease protein
LQELLEKATFSLPELGFAWQPVRLQGLAASQGTTPFSGLFLGFSFFIVVSALMLVSLLFKLGVERRVREIGILLAVGWKPKQVRKLLFREGLLTAMVGGLIGVPLGLGYAALMIWGLQTWWLAAIVTPFLRLFVTPGSLLIGFFAGFVLAMIVIRLAVRKISRLPARKLLAGQVQKESAIKSHETTRKMNWLDVLWLVFLVGNIVSWLFARRSADWQAEMFFGGGTIMLIVTLMMLWSRLRRGATGSAVAEGGRNLCRLAVRNAARRPGRSTLTIGLVASASFLIVAMSVFQLDPSQQAPRLASGNGGFALVAETSQPIFQNLDTPDGRSALGFSDAEETVLSRCRVYSLRVRAGDDASCLNLYKPHSPRILGLPVSFLEHGGFAWADAPADCDNPWELLDISHRVEKEKDRNATPVVLEKNTANYSLNLWGGLGEIYQFQESPEKKSPLEIVALLDNSIFQGDLLVSEESFLRKFPEAGGYRFFLVECPAEKTAEVRKIMENRLGDYGFAAETTGRRLARFLAVQNTYLSTFQSLGGLGLLLGTLGLSAVQLRNVLERRGELALLRAVGFRRRKIAALVLLENAVLLVLGLGSGILAALVAVMPRALSTNASPPWLSLIGILGLVFLVGMLAGLAAVRQVLKAPLLIALREER